MTRIQRVGVLLVAIACRSAVAQQIDAPSNLALEPKHLTIAKQFVAHLDLANTNYAHGTPHVKFGGPYESHADCSGFADALLERSYGYDRKEFRKIFGSGRPSAARYHDTISQQKDFALIRHVQDAQPGDFLAIKYLSRKDNTGHVMLVAARPERMDRPNKPLKPGTVQWQIEVIDSSESGHGPTDTRHKRGPHGKDHDGVGEGLFRIYSDRAGNIVGFAWSTLAASKYRSPDDEHLVIGRLQPSDNHAHE